MYRHCYKIVPLLSQSANLARKYAVRMYANYEALDQ